MRNPFDARTRRSFLTTGGIGAVAAIGMPTVLRAAQPNAEEQANIDAVNAFCGTFTVPFDWDNMASFLSDGCKYRATQTTPVVEGPDAIVGFLRNFAGSSTAAEFVIEDTWARGPVVVNDRLDRFVLPERTLEIPVVGIFYMVDGKIAEWTDFVFDFEF